MNIRFTGDVWVGLIRQENGFCMFKSDYYGYRAAVKILLGYIGRGVDTPEKIINKWAPPSENNTEVYLKYVCEKGGLLPWMQIESIADLELLMIYMTAMERGIEGDARMIRDAITEVLQRELKGYQAEGKKKVTTYGYSDFEY